MTDPKQSPAMEALRKLLRTPGIRTDVRDDARRAIHEQEDYERRLAAPAGSIKCGSCGEPWPCHGETAECVAGLVR